MKHEIEFIIKNNESLAGNKIKNEIEQLLSKYENTENSKTNEAHKFVLNLSQRLDLRSSNKNVALIYLLHVEKYKNNKLKIIPPTSNDECELPSGSYSVSNIQDYIEFIIKKHKILTTIPPIHVYINRTNNRLVFEIKDGYKLESQSPETVKLFGSTKKIIDETQNRENVPTLEVVEVVLVQCNLVDS